MNIVTGDKVNAKGERVTTYSPIRTVIAGSFCLVSLYGLVHGILLNPGLYLVIPVYSTSFFGFMTVAEHRKGKRIKTYKKQLLAHLRQVDNDLTLNDIVLSDVAIDRSGRITGNPNIRFHEGADIEVARREVEQLRREVDAARREVGAAKLGTAELVETDTPNASPSHQTPVNPIALPSTQVVAPAFSDGREASGVIAPKGEPKGIEQNEPGVDL